MTKELIGRSIESFIRSGIGEFEPLALALFAHQFENNPPYQAYCRSLGKTPDHIKRWQDIPAVPIRAFKSVRFATFNAEHAAAIFESSGTTQQIPSRHYLKTLTYYEESLKKSFREHVLPDEEKRMMLILTSPPAEVPHSSLTWMFEVVKNKWGSNASAYLVQRGQLNSSRLTFLLGKAIQKGQPVVLLGTTIAYLKLFEDLEAVGKTLILPAGSVLLDTGGMKTQTRKTTRDEFIALATRWLGLSTEACINEYGMCELSSQCYGRGAAGLLQAPLWMKTLIVHPESGESVKEGESGVLRHFDLANVDSVLAIQTEDMGRAEGAGFHFMGRAEGADLKGCSLAAEKFLAVSR
jgi:phenylacetate-coenzyme A ligase PaaK-like adenylate-forming protein